MSTWLSKIIDKVSNFMAANKGLLPLFAIFLIFLNFVLRQLAPSWLSDTDFFLHLGVILGILGIMLAWAL